MKKLAFITVILLSINAIGQVTAPCGSDYGSKSDEDNIIAAMRYGTTSDAVNAINQAKNTRGTALGCPQLVFNYSPANTTEPLLEDILVTWNTIHAPAISSFEITCPRIGRYQNNAALGAYYARKAGYFVNTAKLAEIADMMYDQQYSTWNTPSPSLRNRGVYGYLNAADTDTCYIGGIVGTSVKELCATLPQYCVTFNNGQFAGNSFAISGQDDDNNWFDGGFAYDHGWTGVQMIESAIQQTDSILKNKYRTSAIEAGRFAITEHCVKNHNYTAKLIWLLAELYAWTGDTIYKNELNYKLNKNLIPGILWDQNNDGYVDETNPPISFSSLHPTAQLPGRMWDGHNALPWYHAMNTWAITEAYIAFRDQGDTFRANELKPYALVMLDNLANEITTLGVVNPDALGVRDITYALLTGIWKISQYENESHPSWESAAWALWNTGYFETYNTHTVCLGLYLLIKSNTTYTPLHLREAVVTSNPLANDNSKINIYPNPTNGYIHIKKLNSSSNYSISTSGGQPIIIGTIDMLNPTIDIQNFQEGLYLLKIKSESGSQIFKIVIGPN